jgi:hypothetical protein
MTVVPAVDLPAVDVVPWAAQAGACGKVERVGVVWMGGGGRVAEEAQWSVIS